MATRVRHSSRNVFRDLGFPREVAEHPFGTALLAGPGVRRGGRIAPVSPGVPALDGLTAAP